VLAQALRLTLLLTDAAPDDEALDDRAKSAYTARRYHEAAQLYDQLWEQRREPRFLYNAAAAHTAAARDLDAAQRYLLYLHHLDTTADDRRDARLSLDQLRARLIALPIALTPPALHAYAIVVATDVDGARLELPFHALDRDGDAAPHLYLSPGTWTIELQLPGELARVYQLPTHRHTFTLEDAGARADPLAFAAARPAAALHLTLGPELALISPVELIFEDQLFIEPRLQLRTQERHLRLELPAGPWRYHVVPKIRRGQPARGRLDLAPSDDTDLELLHLRRDASSHDQRRPHLAAIYGVTGLALVGSGAALITVGADQLRSARYTPAGLPAGYSIDDRHKSALRLPTVGAALLGLGLGASIGALTTSASRHDEKNNAAGARAARRPLILQAGIGAGLAALSGISYSVLFHNLSTQVHHTLLPYPGAQGLLPVQALERYRVSVPATSALLGLGLGLITTATLAILSLPSRPRSPRLPATP
jgi:hypothetical protein